MVPVSRIGLVVALLHNAWLVRSAIWGDALIVMVNVADAPGQLLAVGVTVIVAITGDELSFTATKEGISPVPFAGRPIKGLLFTHLYMVPGTDPVKCIAFVDAPLQRTWSPGCNKPGVGLTVNAKFLAGPGQPLAVGVTEMIAVTGALVAFMALKEGILSLPPAGSPIEILLLVQVKVVPLTKLAKLIPVVGAPLHNTWLDGCNRLAVGLTIILNELAVPEHPLYVPVTDIVATTDESLLLMAVKGKIFPDPDAGSPIVVLLFVQANPEPVTFPLNSTRLVKAPLHNSWLTDWFTIAVGSTIILTVLAGPEQPAAVAITVIIALSGILELLVAMKGAIFPIPVAASPIEVLLFVQL